MKFCCMDMHGCLTRALPSSSSVFSHKADCFRLFFFPETPAMLDGRAGAVYNECTV